MKPTTAFYDWDGDAARLHRHANGDVSADVYRQRRGYVAVSVNDVEWDGVEISEARFNELVGQQDGPTTADRV